MPKITFSESSAANDAIYGKTQAPIKSIILETAEHYEQESFIPTLFSMQRSEHFGESYTDLGSMDEFEPGGENSGAAMNGMEQGYVKTIEDVEWTSRFEITRKIADDSKSVDLKTRPANFTRAFYFTRERFAFQLFLAALKGQSSFKRGKVSFDVTTADGVTLFNTSHPLKHVKGKTVGNKFSDAFSKEALSAVETEMQNFVDDNDHEVIITPDTIVIPNEATIKDTVLSVIGADKDPSTAASNGFNYHYGRWNIIATPYLRSIVPQSGATPWMLIDSQFIQNNVASIFQDRIDLDIRSYVDENTRANVWTGYARFSAGFKNWRFAACGGVTGGTQLGS